MTDESILQEAQRLTHGDRAKDYGHPLDDYTRTAALVSALLAHKLREPLEPHEAAMIQICVKLSRQVNHPKRDNMVDAAGYAWVAQECVDETARRLASVQAMIDSPVVVNVHPFGTTEWPILADQPLNDKCAKSGFRKCPVIGCDCTNCTVARSIAATGV